MTETLHHWCWYSALLASVVQLLHIMNTSSNKPAHLASSAKYPDGQGGHSAPTSGAGASIHSAS